MLWGTRTMGQRVTVEICVGDMESAIAAHAGGADRVELCDNLSVGGTTPSAGLIAESCRRLSIPVHVLIRPRGGDFVYSEPELAVMRHDIEVAMALGAAGVVVSVLTGESVLDRQQMAALVNLARPIKVTCHKAFDQIVEPLEAIDTLIALGVERVLTSGGQPSAMEGAGMLARLVDRAANRLTIMAGGRLSIANLETVITRSRVTAVHLGSAATRTIDGATNGSRSDGSASSWQRVDAQLVAAIVTRARGA
jgi:copper homeostasis protein